MLVAFDAKLVIVAFAAPEPVGETAARFAVPPPTVERVEQADVGPAGCGAGVLGSP